MIQRALINPKMITWARQRAGMSIEELARKLKKDTQAILRWEQGESRPTFKQAQNIARRTYTPFGYLYLREPPEEILPIPDLRIIDD